MVWWDQVDELTDEIKEYLIIASTGTNRFALLSHYHEVSCDPVTSFNVVKAICLHNGLQCVH